MHTPAHAGHAEAGTLFPASGFQVDHHKSNYRTPAVNQKRNIPRRSGELDYYPTPVWGTMALLDHLRIPEGSDLTCCEPAAGGGHMSDVLAPYFSRVDCSDIADPEGRGWGGSDFLMSKPPERLYDWLITNPPFRLADQFALKGLLHARNVALLCRIAFLEGRWRHDNLFSVHPPAEVLVFSQRLTMLKGRVEERASGSVCHAWFIWRAGSTGPASLYWVPPRQDGSQERLRLV